MQQTIKQVCEELTEFLLAKNKAYGDSASDPVRIFSKTDALEQINIRIDDKLSRIARGNEFDSDDTELDLIGYLVLKRAITRKHRGAGKITLAEADKERRAIARRAVDKNAGPLRSVFLRSEEGPKEDVEEMNAFLAGMGNAWEEKTLRREAPGRSGYQVEPAEQYCDEAESIQPVDKINVPPITCTHEKIEFGPYNTRPTTSPSWKCVMCGKTFFTRPSSS